MISQLQKKIIKILSVFFLLSFIMVACNNEDSKKEEPKETPKTEEVSPMQMDSTQKSDTGVLDTRPVKTAD